MNTVHMDAANLLTKIIDEESGEYYRANLIHLNPKDRAKFIYWKQENSDYCFTNDDIYKIEVEGKLPSNIMFDLNTVS